MSPGYEKNKRYRKKYPERRKKERKRNYQATAGAVLNYNNRALWTGLDLAFITLNYFSDRELHKILGRSVQAIQNQRSRLKKEIPPKC